MQLPAFDPTAPALLLAPHLSYPTRNGADIAIEQIARHLSRHVPHVVLLATAESVRYEGGEVAHRASFSNAMRAAPVAALRTVVRRSHYLQERFVTPTFLRLARQHLADPAYRTVLSSFACVAACLPRLGPWPDGRLHLAFTHNDQLEWFRHLGRAARNPLSRLVTRLSERWYFPFFERHGRDFLFVYFTETDLEGHRAELAPHPARVMPIGVELPPEPARSGPHPPGSPARLLFVGALGVQPNLDALSHFAEVFYPPLRAELGEHLEVVVAGSRPLPAVRSLCAAQRWHLHADVSDEALRELYAAATFALLPFPYATGAKLKLLGALAQGVPVLATPSVAPQFQEALPPPCLVSGDPQDWVDRVRAAVAGEVTWAPHTIHAYAGRFSWQGIVARFVHELEAAVPSAVVG